MRTKIIYTFETDLREKSDLFIICAALQNLRERKSCFLKRFARVRAHNSKRKHFIKLGSPACAVIKEKKKIACEI